MNTMTPTLTHMLALCMTCKVNETLKITLINELIDLKIDSYQVYSHTPRYAV